jgi:hypothetical protein
MSLPQAHPTPLDALELGLFNVERLMSRSVRRKTAGVKCNATRAQSSEAARVVAAAATLGASATAEQSGYCPCRFDAFQLKEQQQ